MKSAAAVVQLLNDYLRIELTGHKQYLLAAAQCANWGYERLRVRQEEYAREETTHAARVARRVLFLEGAPEVADLRPVVALASVRVQLEQDHELVSHAIAHLRGAVGICAGEGDADTRRLFEEMLVDEEAHLHWLETQLGLLRELGPQHYLSL